MCVFMTGYSDMAIEHALMKNGSMVRLVCTFFISLRSMIRAVASISSEKVKAGIDRASVIVLVMAFFIPVIFFTLFEKGYNPKVKRQTVKQQKQV